jgi:colanic acid biosynthesis glycosyl transferase WcaI
VVVLHAGNMGAKQALENVVEAARIADQDAAAVRFVLLGNGNQRDSLFTLGSGIDRLEFLNSLNDEDFQGAMAAADILLVNEKPGVTEMAVPSKLTSYFAAARPVIAATDEGSITAEEVESARAGIRVNAGDPRELLRESLALGSDPARSEEFGINGALFQQQVLSAEAAISNYAEIITSQSVKRGH